MPFRDAAKVHRRPTVCLSYGRTSVVPGVPDGERSDLLGLPFQLVDIIDDLSLGDINAATRRRFLEVQKERLCAAHLHTEDADTLLAHFYPWAEDENAQDFLREHTFSFTTTRYEILLSKPRFRPVGDVLYEDETKIRYRQPFQFEIHLDFKEAHVEVTINVVAEYLHVYRGVSGQTFVKKAHNQSILYFLSEIQTRPSVHELLTVIVGDSIAFLADLNIVPNSRPLNRADIGRAEWTVLHATADAMADTPEAVRVFAEAARAMLRLYPCEVCREHLYYFCNSRLNALANVRTRIEAIAWAARLHACVTESLVPVDGAVVSETSRRLAREVREAGDDDAAVAKVVKHSLDQRVS
jgi:hypothetical protein